MMKILVLILIVNSIYSAENIDNSFLQNEINDYGSLKLWLNNYLEPLESGHLDEKVKMFSWQYNINYIDDSYKA